MSNTCRDIIIGGEAEDWFPQRQGALDKMILKTHSSKIIIKFNVEICHLDAACGCSVQSVFLTLPYEYVAELLTEKNYIIIDIILSAILTIFA